MAHMDGREVFAKTVYAEARGEPAAGRRTVAEVIKNRAGLDKSYWGGSSIKGVCLQPGQFECWNGRTDIEIREPERYREIKRMTDQVYDTRGWDPTRGPDHYNNPEKEGMPAWTQNCHEVGRIGNGEHMFYKSKRF